VYYGTVRLINKHGIVYCNGDFSKTTGFENGYGRLNRTGYKHYIKPCTDELKEAALREMYIRGIRSKKLVSLSTEKLKMMFNLTSKTEGALERVYFVEDGGTSIPDMIGADDKYESYKMIPVREYNKLLNENSFPTQVNHTAYCVDKVLDAIPMIISKG
jgi:hypothetical protein